MKSIVSLLLLFCLSFAAAAQSTSPENRIVVLGQATVMVPANQVKFMVVLESTDSTSVDKVYQQHQEQEAKLVKLLKELQIPAADISYSLFSVGKQQDYRTQNWYLMGRQTAVFTVQSVNQYAAIQALLIKEGFTGFSSSFASTELELKKQEVMEKAVAVAKEKAAVLAAAADRKIKRIVKIADTEDTDPLLENYNHVALAEMVVASNSGQSLTEFQQTIPLRTTVKVVFELK
ncbi:SIMPL domain-containing protein [Pontibacter sp. CAU 1760]